MKYFAFVIASLVLAASSNGEKEEKKDTKHSWSYHGKTGPDFWGDLSEDNKACKSGLRQSPIDLGKNTLARFETGKVSTSWNEIDLKLELEEDLAIKASEIVNMSAPGTIVLNHLSVWNYLPRLFLQFLEYSLSLAIRARLQWYSRTRRISFSSPEQRYGAICSYRDSGRHFQQNI